MPTSPGLSLYHEEDMDLEENNIYLVLDLAVKVHGIDFLFDTSQIRNA